MEVVVGKRKRHRCVVLCILLVTAIFCVPINAFGAQLHVMLVADRNAGLPGFDTTVDNVKHLLDAAKSAGIAVRLVEVPDDRVSPERILSEIRTIKSVADPSDSLLFYYIGHGGTDVSVGHLFATSRGVLLRAEVRNAAQQLGVRSVSIITDCCSGEIVQQEGRFAPALTARGVEMFSKLFLRDSGIVDITAATFDPLKPGSGKAFYTGLHGGLFTESVVNLFYRAEELHSVHGDKIFQWKEVFRTLQAEVDSKFKAVREFEIRHGNESRELLDTKEQIPFAFQLGDSTGNADGAIAMTTARQGKKPRFGAVLHTSYGFGVVVNRALEGTPADRLVVYRNVSGRTTESIERLLPGDIIESANGKALKTIDDLYSIIDSVPSGGRLEIEGIDKSTSYKARFKATVILP